jgi:hypothetical protein
LCTSALLGPSKSFNRKKVRLWNQEMENNQYLRMVESMSSMLAEVIVREGGP